MDYINADTIVSFYLISRYLMISHLQLQ